MSLTKRNENVYADECQIPARAFCKGGARGLFRVCRVYVKLLLSTESLRGDVSILTNKVPEFHGTGG